MFYVYVLQSLINGELYVGSTNNLKVRFLQHNQGKVFSTKRYIPWKLIYYEAYMTEKLARVRESKLKNHGNSIRELKKRIGIGDGIHPAPLLSNESINKPKIDEANLGIVQSKLMKSGAGFTLIELIVVVAILSILATFGFLVSLDFYRSYAFNSERDTVVSLLQKARSDALNNVGQVPHGLHFENNKYVLFDRAIFGSLQSQDQIIPADIYISHGVPTDVVFIQLSGDTVPQTISLNDNRRSAVITLNANGMINW